MVLRLDAFNCPTTRSLPRSVVPAAALLLRARSASPRRVLPRPRPAPAPLRPSTTPPRKYSPAWTLQRSTGTGYIQAPGPAHQRRVILSVQELPDSACPPFSPSSTSASARGVAGQGPRALGAGSWACSWPARGCAAAALKTGGFFRLATAFASPPPHPASIPFRSAFSVASEVSG